MSETYKVAMECLARGWNPLPIRPGGKLPALESWKELQTRGVTPDEAEMWWGEHPELNLAVITGVISGIVVLDVDPRNGGLDSLSGLEIPPTLTCHTPSGGLHFYFIHPGGRVSNKVNLKPGLDLRADAGYVLIPPSRIGQVEYAWAAPPDRCEIAAPPPWLMELLQPAKEEGAARSVDDWRRLVSEGVTEGQRNDSITALAGHLLRKYVDPLIVLDLCLIWNRERCYPPLPDEEVVTIVDSVANKEADRREEVEKFGRSTAA
ncbi:MAG TPA: DNA primase [Firmicutes bacterium]|nr:DNA primase [Bacillota bacterium]